MLFTIFNSVVTVGMTIALLSFLFPMCEVVGESMYPTLKEGDIIVCCRLFKIKKGSIYIFSSPTNKIVIKRLKYKRRGSMFNLYFEGDNKPYSHDSRHYGCVNSSDVKGRFLFILKRAR